MDKYNSNENVNCIKAKMMENTVLVNYLSDELEYNKKEYKIIDRAFKFGPIGIVCLFGATGVALTSWYVALLSIPFIGITSIFLYSTRMIIKRDIDYTSHMLNKKSKLNEYYLDELLKKNVKFEIQEDVKMMHDIPYFNSNDKLINLVNDKILAKFGMTYDEFQQLGENEQHKLIQQTKGKKFIAKNTIDGMPIDNDHLRTIEYVDNRIDEICSIKRKVKKK